MYAGGLNHGPKGVVCELLLWAKVEAVFLYLETRLCRTLCRKFFLALICVISHDKERRNMQVKFYFHFYHFNPKSPPEAPPQACQEWESWAWLTHLPLECLAVPVQCLMQEESFVSCCFSELLVSAITACCPLMLKGQWVLWSFCLKNTHY